MPAEPFAPPAPNGRSPAEVEYMQTDGRVAQGRGSLPTISTARLQLAGKDETDETPYVEIDGRPCYIYGAIYVGALGWLSTRDEAGK